MEVFFWRLPLRDRPFVPCLRIREKDGEPVIEIGSYDPNAPATGTDFLAISREECRAMASVLGDIAELDRAMKNRKPSV